MKRCLLLFLIIVSVTLQACTVDNLYQTINQRWELQLPKAVTIINGENNSGQKLTSSTKDLDYIFKYDSVDKEKLDNLTIWNTLAPRDIAQVVKQLYAYYFPDDETSLTPAERATRLEDKLGFKIDEQLKYYSKKDTKSPTGGRIILLYDSEEVQIRAYHFVD